MDHIIADLEPFRDLKRQLDAREINAAQYKQEYARLVAAAEPSAPMCKNNDGRVAVRVTIGGEWLCEVCARIAAGARA